ncbi:Hypothetical predicted protein [Octopus vulgaris]|uniref:Uncharacterized protein n=1 Tax=Octopus vulgaris TaxID=6645 RepID=A0AA36B221_OCTVU|nr:Hypothetical predicted protein [Octopus vulgaris]
MFTKQDDQCPLCETAKEGKCEEKSSYDEGKKISKPERGCIKTPSSLKDKTLDSLSDSRIESNQKQKVLQLHTQPHLHTSNSYIHHEFAVDNNC